MSVMASSLRNSNISVEDWIIANKPFYNELDTDYKIEVIALNLLNFYKEIHHLFLKRLGGNERTYRKDIKSISVDLLGLDENVLNLEQRFMNLWNVTGREQEIQRKSQEVEA